MPFGNVAPRRRAKRFAEHGRRVAAELDGVGDIYAGPMSQVQVSTWSKGHFVLLGDAAYCPTPLTRSGCALALVGAYVLAGEIARHADHAHAFAAYEALVRPYAEAAQRRLSPAVIRLLHPRSRFGVSLTRGVERLIASRPIQATLRPSDAARARRIADDFTLPVYR